MLIFDTFAGDEIRVDMAKENIYLHEPSATKVKVYPLRGVCHEIIYLDVHPTPPKLKTHMARENPSRVGPKFFNP